MSSDAAPSTRPPSSANWWRSGHVVPLVVLAAAFLATTIPFPTDYPFTWDGGQFVLAVHYFSVVLHQPHPPGYALFVGAGKLLSYFFSAHRSLQILSAGFAAGAVLCLYVLCWQVWRRRGLALLLAMAFLLNPLLWFYRETCLTYTVDAFAGTLTALLGWLGLRRRPAFFYWNALLLGLVGGFRPSLVFLLAPLLLLPVVLSRSWKRLAVTLLVLAGACLPWYVVLVASVGGLQAYRELSGVLFAEATRSTSYLLGAPFQTNWAVFKRLLHAILACLNVMAIPALVSLARSLKNPGNRRDGFPPLMLVAWVLPPMLFYSLIHYGPLGYVLIFIPSAYVLMGSSLPDLRHAGPAAKVVAALSLTLLLVLHGSVFAVLTPSPLDSRPPLDRVDRILQPLASAVPALFSMNAAVLRDFDHRVQSYVQLARSLDSGRTIVLCGESAPGASYRREWREPADNLYRSLGAELPEYLVFHVPGVAPKPKYVLKTWHWHSSYWGDTLSIPGQVRNVVFAIDSIPPRCKIEGLRLETRPINGLDCLVGKIEGGDFRYCGARFHLEGPEE